MENLSALAEELKLYEAEADADVTAAAASDEAPPVVEGVPTPSEKSAEEDVAPTPEVEDKAEPPKAPAAEEKTPKTVPLAALLEERDKRSAAERELAVLKARDEERAKFQQQQQETEQQRAQREAAERARVAQEAEERKSRPDENEDPIAAAEWDKQYEERKRHRDTEESNARMQNDILRVELTADRTAFSVKQPDYQEALNWTIERELKDYEEIGVPRERALFEINRRAGELIQIARSQGKSVAETFYKYAKLRGYSAPAAQTEQKPAPVAPKPPTAAEKLATADEGRKIASLGNGAGGQVPTTLSDEQIDNMNSEQLHEWLKKPANRQRYNRMMGAEA